MDTKNTPTKNVKLLITEDSYNRLNKIAEEYGTDFAGLTRLTLGIVDLVHKGEPHGDQLVLSKSDGSSSIELVLPRGATPNHLNASQGATKKLSLKLSDDVYERLGKIAEERDTEIPQLVRLGFGIVARVYEEPDTKLVLRRSDGSHLNLITREVGKDQGNLASASATGTPEEGQSYWRDLHSKTADEKQSPSVGKVSERS
jgi:hypothetical protein